MQLSQLTAGVAPCQQVPGPSALQDPHLAAGRHLGQFDVADRGDLPVAVQVCLDDKEAALVPGWIMTLNPCRAVTKYVDLIVPTNDKDLNRRNGCRAVSAPFAPIRNPAEQRCQVGAHFANDPGAVVADRNLPKLVLVVNRNIRPIVSDDRLSLNHHFFVKRFCDNTTLFKLVTSEVRIPCVRHGSDAPGGDFRRT